MKRSDLIAKLDKTLREKRDRLRQTIGGMTRQGQQDAYLGDMADRAVSTANLEVRATLTAAGNNELAMINDAIKRIQDGTYGICGGCGRPIPTARLEALPFASLCVNCQREVEKGGFITHQGPFDLADQPPDFSDLIDELNEDIGSAISLRDLEVEA